MNGHNWRALAEEQRDTFFGAEAGALSEKRMQSMLTTLEAICNMQPDEAADKARLTTISQRIFCHFSCNIADLLDLIFEFITKKALQPPLPFIAFSSMCVTRRMQGQDTTGTAL